MIYLLLDTCIYIDLGSNHKLTPVLEALDKLVKSRKVRLLVPDIVADEFNRHKPEIVEKYGERLKSITKNAHPAIDILPEEEAEKARKIFEKIHQSIDAKEESLYKNVKLVEDLINHGSSVKLKINTEIKDKVIQRGLDKKAPFQSHKNSTADACIIELFDEFQMNKPDDCEQLIFVTANHKDFSDKDQREPHPDLASIFQDTNKSSYSINLAEVLNEIEANIISNSLTTYMGQYIRSSQCTAGIFHVLEEGGFARMSQYGGMTWHKRCLNCGRMFDTGEFLD